MREFLLAWLAFSAAYLLVVAWRHRAAWLTAPDDDDPAVWAAVRTKVRTRRPVEFAQRTRWSVPRNPRTRDDDRDNLECTGVN